MRRVFPVAVLTALVFGFALIGASCSGMIHHAFAQESEVAEPPHNHDAGHSEFHDDVYSHWRTPGSGVSCCNEKKTVDGRTTGDCYPTEAWLAPAGPKNPELKHGELVWYALLDDGRKMEIPESRIVHEKNPDPTGTRAHVCIMDGSDVPLCFVPPTGGT